MPNHVCRVVPIIGLFAIVGCAAQSQRIGQSATVQFGTVRSAQEVKLDSNAAQGAIIGGTLGLTRSRGGSSARTVRNGIIGATAGGALSTAAAGSRMGMEYIVDKVDGSSARIITDQREIRAGDCVAIERVRETANIRRTSTSYCDKASERAVQSVGDDVRSEAVRCEAAKQDLVEAGTDESVDLAIRKIELLCNG